MATMSPKKVIKKRYKIFPFWPPFPPIKISGYGSALGHLLADSKLQIKIFKQFALDS